MALCHPDPLDAPMTEPVRSFPATLAPSRAATYSFRALLGFDALIAAVAAGFFLVGLSDGSVSSFNAGIWTVLLGGLALVIGGAIALRRAAQTALSIAVLMLPAVPVFLYCVLIMMALLLQPRWN
jgi:hypothetical protein